METSVGGRALQVVKSEDDKSFEVDEDALTKILLDSRVRNSKVMIVSVAGAYRRGKSFLLNFFLKYLKNPGNPDWMGNPNEPLVGFSWKGGSERTTSGILLWSEPFFITLPSGEKVCILLMDTQGAFDSETTVKECATVFAFSTMVSSVQVYNITHNIQEDDLQHLELFTEYGRLALEAYNDKPFQSLHFLVRDWQYPYQHPYGLEGGKVFLERRLEIKEKQAFELQNLRKNISQCFKDIHCFLMPHPGLSVATSATFNGSLADIESDFKTNLKTFTEFLFNPKNVVVKTINGNQITGKELVEYFKSYIKVFQGNILPEPKTMMEATAEANNLAAIANARDLYSREMEKVCEGNKPYLNEKTLADHHDKCFIEAMEQFRKTRKMGGDDFCSTFEIKLESELLELFERYKKNNKAKSVMSTAQTPIFFIALCFVSYVMSGLFSLLGSECLVSVGNLLMSLSIICLFAWCYSRYTGQYRWLGETLDKVARQCSDYFKLGSPPELNLASAAGAVSKAAGAIGSHDRRKDQ